MRLAELAARLNRAQQGRFFKIAASVLILALSLGAILTYSVQSARARQDLPMLQVQEAGPEEGAVQGSAEEVAARVEIEKARRESAQATVNALNAILERRLSVVDFSVGVGLIAGVALVVVWLGLALTYLGVLLVGLALALPLVLWGSPWWRGVGVFVAGSLALASSFTALVQTAKIALGGPHPVLAIARNVVYEAVRMKVSAVFIVLLIFGLAALPGVLDPNSPLRYRVQAFLTYGMEGSFMVVAALTVFLACATVAFEQRDKIIWQTMTKPVRSWEYVLGKWLGVSAVSLVLMGVASSGVYLFTEYLRNQPAQGEARPFVSQSSLTGGGEAVSMDRLVLETQVLTARKSVNPSPPRMIPEEFAKEMDRRVERAAQSDPEFRDTPEARAKLMGEFDKELIAVFYAVPPGTWRQYDFPGLGPAKARGTAITLRFKADAGNNNPTDTYRLTFAVGGADPVIREIRLGQFISLPLSPASVEMYRGTAGPEGVLRLQVFNGDVQRQTMNKETVTFNPSGGLEVSYPVDTFRANFLRIAAVAWLKLAFLASVGLMLGTFLSFPVAALSAFGVLICAEGVPFLRAALDSYGTQGYDQETLWWRFPIIWISEAVAFLLGFYARINPAENIATGRFVGWMSLVQAVGVFGGLSCVVLAAGSAIFRRRELATYSGH
ncbi:MAG: ABC transporter permease [Phycisphaerales bacterium]